MIEGEYDITAKELVYSNDDYAIVETEENCYKVSKEGESTKLFEDGCVSYTYIEDITNRNNREATNIISYENRTCTYFIKDDDVYSIYASHEITYTCDTLSEDEIEELKAQEKAGKITIMNVSIKKKSKIQIDMQLNSESVVKKEIIVDHYFPSINCHMMGNKIYIIPLNISSCAFAFDILSNEMKDYGENNYYDGPLETYSVGDYLMLKSTEEGEWKLVKNGEVIEQADKIQLCKRENYIGILLTTGNKLKVLRV